MGSSFLRSRALSMAFLTRKPAKPIRLVIAAVLATTCPLAPNLSAVKISSRNLEKCSALKSSGAFCLANMA